MRKETAEARVIKEVKELLGAQDASVEELPDILKQVMVVLTAQPVVVSFSVNPFTGKTTQVAVSTTEKTPEVFTMLAASATQLSQQFSKLAVEVAKNVGAKE